MLIFSGSGSASCGGNENGGGDSDSGDEGEDKNDTGITTDICIAWLVNCECTG